MFGSRHPRNALSGGLLGAGARELMRNEHSSAAMATLASRAMTDPESLTYAEIRSLGACVLTQTPNRK